MDKMQQERQRQQIYRHAEYDTGIMKIRLDTGNLLQKLELFLRGERLAYTTDTAGYTISTTKTSGKPKANEAGVQSILSHVTAIINPHVVQGNFTRDMYDNYIYNTRIDLSKTIMVNLYEWKIDTKDYECILNFIMSLVKPFMSRLIDNKERDSYGNTFKTNETVMSAPLPKKSVFPFLRGGHD